ncbi:nuclear transport factor 2 family protein [Acidocella sp.]|uniref:nuclear transport factor 2 family protein n=1 Tax=Acidocella sp. TaxID=50710 RepID=UPI0026093FF5|nr:nuclear transport factor 2 family protein [Acidocella sp.]
MSGASEIAGGELRALIDKQAITELLYRYCRAVDRIDPELGYTVWQEGAEADYGSIYQGSGRGVVDFICDSHRRGVVHSHQVTNIIIALEGDVARSEAYITSGMVMLDGGEPKQITTRGRYLDRWSRRAGRWGIEKRIFVGDINEIRTITPGSIVPRFTLDRDDPSYALFAG